MVGGAPEGRPGAPGWERWTGRYALGGTPTTERRPLSTRVGGLGQCPAPAAWLADDVGAWWKRFLPPHGCGGPASSGGGRTQSLGWRRKGMIATRTSRTARGPHWPW
eukprot:416943-Alexandrium_andersonii.AAC.1